MIDLSAAPLQRQAEHWPAARAAKLTDTVTEIIEAFRTAMAEHNLNPSRVEATGELVRFDVDERGDKAGWYSLHVDGVPAGAFGNWKTSLNEKWCSREIRTMTDAERAEYQRFNERVKGQRAEAKRKHQQEAATTARQRWEAAQPADPAHPYLSKKRIKPHGTRQEDDKLLVPMRDESGQVWAVQTIDANGNKLFQPKGCRTKGLYFSIGAPAPGGSVCIAEGFATGAAIHEATGHPVACAMTAGNLEDVARIVKGKFPGHPIVLCADDDRKPDTDKNPGIEAATKAALAVGGVVALPNMGKKSDFWDVLNECGADAVRRQIDQATQPVSAGEAARRAAFSLVKLAEIKTRPADWLVDGIIERDCLGVFFGDPGAGKSFVAVDLACSVAIGTDWHGRIVKRAPVVYIAGEGMNGLKKRFEAWSIRHQTHLGDAPLFISTMPASLLDGQSVADVQAAIDAIVEQHGPPGLIVIDTLARNFGAGDENSTTDMGAFIAAADQIRTRYRAAILLIHHTGHGDKTRARGAMALKGALDYEYRLAKGDDEVVRVDCTKVKDHEPPEPMAFKLRSVELAMKDDQDRPVTSAVLDGVEYAPAPRPGKAGRGKRQAKAPQVLRELFDHHRQNLVDDGRDPESARVAFTEWKDRCLEEGIERNRFQEIWKSLGTNRIVDVVNGFVRIIDRPKCPKWSEIE